MVIQWHRLKHLYFKSVGKTVSFSVMATSCFNYRGIADKALWEGVWHHILQRARVFCSVLLLLSRTHSPHPDPPSAASGSLPADCAGWSHHPVVKERGRSELWRLHFLMHFSNSVWEVFITLSSSCWYRSLISSSYWVFSESERGSGGGAEVSIMGGASELFNSLLLCCSSTGTESPKDKEVKYISPTQLQQ